MPDKRTYADRAEYIKQAVAKRRKKVRVMLVEYKGGKCILCGYHKIIGALELHHIDSSKKDFGLSAHGLTKAWVKVKKEADKCILVCANCHREIHAGVVQLPREILVEKTR
jgi:transcription elongation factor Elf1